MKLEQDGLHAATRTDLGSCNLGNAKIVKIPLEKYLTSQSNKYILN